MLGGTLVQPLLKLDSLRDQAEVPGLVDQSAADLLGVSQRQLEGDVPTGAVTKCNSVAQAQGPEKPGGVISMLGRAPAWPIVRTAAQGPAAVVGDHSEARETLGDGTPPLGVLGTGVDQQHREPEPRTSVYKVVPLTGTRTMRGGSAPGSPSGFVLRSVSAMSRTPRS